MPPGLAHALLALGLQALVAVPLLATPIGAVPAAALGGALAAGFYLGRERRQSEEWAGSNRIPPWVWKPRALRDLAWPVLAVAAVVAAVALARPAWSHGLGFTAEEAAWLDRQRSHDGTKCCDVRDVQVGQGVEWRLSGGRYEVRIRGEWRAVPPGRLMRHDAADPTPWPGQALLFWSPAPHAPEGFFLWCFFPEPLT
jgi:hypothetical protein